MVQNAVRNRWIMWRRPSVCRLEALVEMSDPTAAQTRDPSAPRLDLHALGLQRAALVLGLWLAVSVVYWPTSLALARLWVNTAEETYTHGFLILAISLWLVVRSRHRLAAAPAQPVLGALLLLLLLSAVWVWAWRASIQELHMMMLPVILFTVIVAALGWSVARIVAFPVGYLYFALPFWSGGVFLLQDLSAKMVGVLLWLTGVPGFMQGNLIRLPSGTIEIAGGCSGIHSFIVGLALATLYGVLFELPWRRLLWGLALMAGITLVVNWIRIFIVAVAAYETDMRSSLVRNHYWLGWWLFAVGFAGFLWWMERKAVARAPLARPNEVPVTPAHAAAGLAAGPAAARLSPARTVATVVALALALILLVAFATGLRTSVASNHYWFGWTLCAAALAGFLWWIGRRRAAPPRPAAQPAAASTRGRIGPAQIVASLVALAILPAAAYGLDWAHAPESPSVAIDWPAAPPGWEGPTHAYATAWHPVFRGAGGKSLRQYTSVHGAIVQVFAVAYREQTQHAKLLGYWNRLLGTGHALRHGPLRIVASPSGRWRQMRVTDATGMASLIWSRYRIGARTFVAPRLSQFWYGLVSLIDPPLSSLRALRTDCVPDCAAAQRRLAAAASILRPRFLPGQ